MKKSSALFPLETIIKYWANRLAPVAVAMAALGEARIGETDDPPIKLAGIDTLDRALRASGEGLSDVFEEMETMVSAIKGAGFKVDWHNDLKVFAPDEMEA